MQKKVTLPKPCRNMYLSENCDQTKPGIYCHSHPYKVCGAHVPESSKLLVSVSCEILILVMRLGFDDEPLHKSTYSSLVKLWADCIVFSRLNINPASVKSVIAFEFHGERTKSNPQLCITSVAPHPCAPPVIIPICMPTFVLNPSRCAPPVCPVHTPHKQ